MTPDLNAALADCGLDRATQLRLLHWQGARFSKADRLAYYQTPHWKRIVAAMIERYKRCAVCKRTARLSVHHVHYRTLFQENLETDLALLCAGCHRKH